jgi:hypothetical protein
MSNSTGNLFILAIIIACYAGYLLDAKNLFKSKLLRKIIGKILPKRKDREYKILDNLLVKSSLDMDMIDLYAIKTTAFVAASLLLFMVFITNTQVKQRQVFETPVYSTYSQSDFHNNPSTRLKNFNLMKVHVDITGINNNDAGFEAVKSVLSKYGDVDSDRLNDSASVILKDAVSLKPLYSVSRKIKYGLWAVVFFFVPDLLLKLYSIVIVRKKEEEVYSLVNLLVMVGSNPNVTSRNMLKALIDNSNYLKPYLVEFETNYLVGRDAAYEKFLNDERYKCISKIISALRQVEESDKISTVHNLKSGNESIEKSRKLNFENKVEKKEGIAFVIFVVGVCILVKIIFDVSIAGISNMGNMKI